MICDQINKCSQALTVPRKTLQDPKGCYSKFEIDNPLRKTFDVIDFENGVYQGRQRDTKCDYGVKTEDSIFYLELKGSDVKKGVKQLLATIEETKNCFFNLVDEKDKKPVKIHLTKKARLIVSRFPKPDIIKQSKEYRDLVKAVGHIENNNNHLIIKQDVYSENI